MNHDIIMSGAGWGRRIQSENSPRESELGELKEWCQQSEGSMGPRGKRPMSGGLKRSSTMESEGTFDLVVAFAC